MLTDLQERGKETLGGHLADLPEYLQYRNAQSDFFSYDDPMVFAPAEVYIPVILTIQAINNAYRKRFLSAKKRLLVLPPCIRKMKEKSCRAKKRRPLRILHCTACQPDCHINRITVWAETQDIDTYIAPRKMTEVFKRIKKRHPSVGIVGVACFLDLLMGMIVSMEIGLAPQGVALVANRCVRWSGEELKSAVDVKWLGEVLGLPDPPHLPIIDGERDEMRQCGER